MRAPTLQQHQAKGSLHRRGQAGLPQVQAHVGRGRLDVCAGTADTCQARGAPVRAQVGRASRATIKGPWLTPSTGHTSAGTRNHGNVVSGAQRSHIQCLDAPATIGSDRTRGPSRFRQGLDRTRRPRRPDSAVGDRSTIFCLFRYCSQTIQQMKNIGPDACHGQ
jgi:hypothetical protein